MAASSGGMNGNNQDEIRNEMPNLSPSNVHVFDFKFKSDELSENLNFVVTNELVRYFGNPSYYVDRKDCSGSSSARNPGQDNEASGGSSSDTAKVKDSGDLRGFDIHHRVLDPATQNRTGKVSKTVLNRKYLCMLYDDGHVLRAGCQCVENGISTPKYAPNLGGIELGELFSTLGNGA